MSNQVGPTLIGREHPAELLRAEIDRLITSHGGLVLVTGEAGIGKTTLVTSAAREARELGALVLSGSCWDSDSAPGYWPWVQVIRALRRVHPDDGLGVLLGESAASEGFQIYDAVTSALVAASHERPVAVVLDDLHWADAPSLRLLEFAAQHTWFERLLLIGTYRDTEVETGAHPARPLLAPLLAKATTITLTGLDDRGVATLMARTSGQEPPDSLVESVRLHTGGNPFYVEQSARLWRSGGSATSVSPGVRDALSRRLSLLPASVTALLTTAAVLGRSFHRQVLAATAGVPAAHADRLLAEAVSARLVETRGGGRFAFAHDLVRETLYGTLDEPTARATHAAALTALESFTTRTPSPGSSPPISHNPAPSPVQGGSASPPSGARTPATDQGRDGVPPVPALSGMAVARGRGEWGRVADLAGHAWLAGDAIEPERAVEHLLTAARGAHERLSSEERIRHLDRARALTRDPIKRGEISLDLARALYHTADTTGAAAAVKEIVTIAREHDDPDLLARAALTVHAESGFGEAQELLREAHSKLIGHPAPGERLARELALHIAVSARRNADDNALLFGLWARHDVIWGPGTAGERVGLLAELIDLARRTDNEELEHFAQSLRWVALLEQGDPLYLEQFAAFTNGGQESDLQSIELAISIDRAILAALHGRFAEAEIEPHADHGKYAFMVDHHRWALRMLQGRLDEASQAAEELRTSNHPSPALIGALTAAERGDLQPAQRLLSTTAVGGSPPVSVGSASQAEPVGEADRMVEPLWLRLRAEVAAATRDPELCARSRADLEPHRGHWLVSLYGWDVSGPVSLWIARIDAAEQRWDEAIEGFTDAYRSADRLRARPWSVIARAYLGEALLATGDPAAGTVLSDAEREAAELGMPHLVERIRALGNGARIGEFRRDGAVWTLGFAGRVIHHPDAKGLHDLHALLSHPGQDLSAVKLLDPAGGDLVVAARSLGGDPVLDDEAKSRYRRRLDALDEEIDRAAVLGDDRRAATLDHERSALLTELRNAAGLGGRDRRLGDEAERARKTVTARIRDILRKLDQAHPDLAAHLRATVSTGATCRYHPDPDLTWHL